jgi:hypothetical protein
MNDIVVYYNGGSGGFFIYFYILGSDSNIVAQINRVQIGKNKKFLDVSFYEQFKKHNDLKNWKNTEKWPSFEKSVNNDNRRIFLACNIMPENFDVSNMVIVNPYISDKKKWLKIQATKRCRDFMKLPKNTNFKDFYNHYKTVYKKLPDTSVIKGADYSFDFLQFLQDKKEREKLCNFLNIKINSRMENYLKHYIECHGDFFDRLIK